MDGWRRWLRMGAILGLIVTAYWTMPVSLDLDAGAAAGLAISLVALSLLAVAVLSEVRLQMMNPDRRLDALVIAMMIAVLGFAFGFYLMSQRDPTQIVGLETRLDALYFTMTTLLTVGYGDIHAAGQAARLLVLVAMVFNVVIIAAAGSTVSGRVRSNAEKRAEERRAAAAEGTVQQGRLRRRDRQDRRTHRNPT